MILLWLACAKETAPPPPPTTPAPLQGDWYLTDWINGRRIVLVPCNAKRSHLVLVDKDGKATVAARRIQSVYIGKVNTIGGEEGHWRYTMSDQSTWAFDLLGGAELLRFTGPDPSLNGPWVREAALDAYERVHVPEVECGKPDLLPTVPADLSTRWWRVVAGERGWTLPPGGGDVAPLELDTTGPLQVIRRNGAGETRWKVDRLEAAADAVDLTVHVKEQDYLGMRFMTHRPAPPPFEVAQDGTSKVPAPPEPAPEPLPPGARFIALPGEPAWSATVWIPEDQLKSMPR